MKFWDSSALVPLLVEEAASPSLEALFIQDPGLVAWYASTVECCSALMRRVREGAMPLSEADRAMEKLSMLASSWVEVAPTAKVCRVAERLLRIHHLRAADSMQLAAAWVATDGEPRRLPFICMDERLSRAAALEGFSVPTLP